MKKGLVIWKNRNKGLVLSEGFSLTFVRAKEGLAVGKRIYFFEEDIVHSYSVRRRYMSTAAVLLIAVMLIGLFTWPGTVEAQAYEVITLDINPSIEIYVAEDGTVLKVKPLDAEARELIKAVGSDLRGKDKDYVLDSLIEEAADQGYNIVKTPDDGDVEEDSDIGVVVSVTVLDKDASEEDKEAEIKEVQTFLESRTDQYHFLMVKGTTEDYRAAKSHGLSLGKYTMLKFLAEAGEVETGTLTTTEAEMAAELEQKVTSGATIKEAIKEMKKEALNINEKINENKKQIQAAIENGSLDAVEINGKKPAAMPENSNKDKSKNNNGNRNSGKGN